MAANTNLHKAKQAKNDEFYTQLSDVEKELKHYKDHFKDKIVLCNCDDPTYSAFWKYFHLNFSVLGLKRLISTHYSKDHSTYKMEYEGGNDNDVNVGKITPFEGGERRFPLPGMYQSFGRSGYCFDKPALFLVSRICSFTNRT